MKVLVSGASGFIGQHLLPLLHYRGHHAIALNRGPKSSTPEPSWDPGRARLDASTLVGFDAIIHLSGEYVAERWTAEKKRKIYDSRVQSTQLLARTIAGMENKPKVLLCASASGFYGNRGSEVLAEDAAPGNGFLSQVCVDWEAALHIAAHAGVRTSAMRLGIVLSTTGGVFPRILKPFKRGIGGRVGNGQQYVSWITIEDAVEAIAFLLDHETLTGPVNICSPHPATNNDIVTQLGTLLHCAHTFPVPITLAHFAFGAEMSNEVLLSSTRAVPERLTAAGFQFKHADVQRALQHLLRDRI